MNKAFPHTMLIFGLFLIVSDAMGGAADIGRLVALQIDERPLYEGDEHSYMTDAMIRALTQAGYRVCGDPVNFNLLDRIAMVILNSDFLASMGYESPTRPDILIKGIVESHYKNDSNGILDFIGTHAVLTAVDVDSGKTLAYLEESVPKTLNSRSNQKGISKREVLSRSLAIMFVKRLVIAR